MSRDEVVRVASGQGFWGDDLEAPVRQVEGGGIDYLMLDYLAEVTMSIMQKQRSRDPAAGYARDFVPLMERIFARCVDDGVRVVTNAGGVNPSGCADAWSSRSRRLKSAGRASSSASAEKLDGQEGADGRTDGQTGGSSSSSSSSSFL